MFSEILEKVVFIKFLYKRELSAKNSMANRIEMSLSDALLDFMAQVTMKLTKASIMRNGCQCDGGL